MERSFIATKESKYYIDLHKYMGLLERQRKFVDTFFSEKEIESIKYIMSGDGFINIPFDQEDVKDITLSIKPSENDVINFKTIICKPNKIHGLSAFKKSSNISKEFSQKCIDEKIIINLSSPRISDYFESLGYSGYEYTQFEYDNNLYIKVDSKYLGEADIPEGFIDIRLSDFYIAKENFDSKNIKEAIK